MILIKPFVGFPLPDLRIILEHYGTIRRVTNPVHICLDEARDGYRQGMHVSSIDIHSIINAAVHPVADVIKDGQDFVSSDIRTRQKASIHRIRINPCRIWLMENDEWRDLMKILNEEKYLIFDK